MDEIEKLRDKINDIKQDNDELRNANVPLIAFLIVTEEHFTKLSLQFVVQIMNMFSFLFHIIYRKIACIAV